MTPKCIAERDEVRLRTILIAREVRKAVREIAGPIEEYWSEVPLAVGLMQSVPDLDGEFELIRESLPTMADDDLEWMLDIGPGPWLAWLIVKEIQRNRPHLDRNGG